MKTIYRAVMENCIDFDVCVDHKYFKSFESAYNWASTELESLKNDIDTLNYDETIFEIDAHTETFNVEVYNNGYYNEEHYCIYIEKVEVNE